MEERMARMVVVWQRPEDTSAFDEHYFRTHVPLAKKLPGLRKYEVSSGPITVLYGPPSTYLVAILHFDSLEAIRRAFATPEGQACARDRQHLAPNEAVQIFLFDDREV
jgi:uncharacterized protein (TIGR02118 family)